MLLFVSDGHLRVYSEVDDTKPLGETEDPNPMRVKFVSFAVYEPSIAEFFYDCDLF